MMELFYYGCEFVHTAAIVWTIWRIIAGIGRVKVNPVWEIASQTLVITFLAAAHVYNSSLGQGVFSNSLVLLSVLILSMAMRLVYANRLSDNLLISCIFWVIVSLGDLLIQTVTYLVLFQTSATDFLMEVSVGRGIYLLVWTVLIIIFGNELVRRTKQHIVPLFKYRVWLWGANIALLCCMVYFQRIYLYKTYNVPELLLNHWWIFGLSLALVVVLFVAYWVKENEQKKSQLTQMKFKLLENNYQQMMIERTNKNILVHDIKNHLIVISRLIEQGENEKAESYIREMYAVLESKKNCVITNHLLLDLILDNKIMTAGEKGIRIEVESDDLSGMQLSDMETCSLFANLLDNAIEANERRDADAGWVEMTCSRKNKLLMINVVNPTDKVLDADIGLPETSKADKDLHGFGMRSIQQIADTYGGYMNYYVEDGKFQITVCISAFERIAEYVGDRVV